MKLSIIIPLYNEEGLIHELFHKTSAALNQITDDWEVICINDGSTDHTLSELVNIWEKEKKWKIINLSKNFGHQAAIWAGLNNANGDYIGIMDGDLQDDPAIFQEFLNEINKGFDVVYCIRNKRKESSFKKFSYWLFYRLLKYAFGVSLPIDSGDFSLLRKRVVVEMLKMPEQGLFIRGIRSWVGFKQSGIICERNKRIKGTSKYSFRELRKLAYNGMFGFSDFPIRLLGRLGAFVICFSIIYTIYILTKRLIWGIVPAGFTTLILVILFFGGIQLLTIRILGEYIHRIYNESRKRPLYIICSKYGIGE